MRIIATYITDNAPRQLNLASKERSNLLQALAITTHPSAFQSILRTVEWSLRHQAHPNFIRWSICNGARERIIFAKGLGITIISFGLIISILLALSSAHRAWRIWCFIPFVIGIVFVICSTKGMCTVSYLPPHPIPFITPHLVNRFSTNLGPPRLPPLPCPPLGPLHQTRRMRALRSRPRTRSYGHSRYLRYL